MGTFSDRHGGVVDALPDSVLDKIDMDKLPRFELAKQGDLVKGETAANRASSRGGVIKVDRESTNSNEVGRHVSLTFAKTALSEIGTVQDSKGRDVTFASDVVAHWEKPDKAGRLKSTKDINGRIAALDDAIKAVEDPDHIIINERGNRMYIKKTNTGAVAAIASPVTGKIVTVLPTTRPKELTRWLKSGSEEPDR